MCDSRTELEILELTKCGFCLVRNHRKLQSASTVHTRNRTQDGEACVLASNLSLKGGGLLGANRKIRLRNLICNIVLLVENYTFLMRAFQLLGAAFA